MTTGFGGPELPLSPLQIAERCGIDVIANVAAPVAADLLLIHDVDGNVRGNISITQLSTLLGTGLFARDGVTNALYSDNLIGPTVGTDLGTDSLDIQSERTLAAHFNEANRSVLVGLDSTTAIAGVPLNQESVNVGVDNVLTIPNVGDPSVVVGVGWTCPVSNNALFGRGGTLSAPAADICAFVTGAGPTITQSGMVVIGASIAGATGKDGVVIGKVASVTAADGIAIARNAVVSAASGIAIGRNAAVTHANAGAFGKDAVSTAIDTFTFGSVGTPYNVEVTGNATIAGKLTVVGLIDPTGMEFAAVGANPGADAAKTLWVNSGDSNKLYFGASEVGGGGGGTPGGADTQVQFNDGGAFGGDAGLVYNKTTNQLSIVTGSQSIAQGAITAAAPALNITSTWNNGAVTFEGVVIDVLDTASVARSAMLAIKTGGVDLFFVCNVGIAAINHSANTWMAANTTGANSRSGLRMEKGGVLRWDLGKNTITESGSDAGSNFELRAIDDASAVIDSPIEIARVAGGDMILRRPLSIVGGNTRIDERFGAGLGTISLDTNTGDTAYALTFNATDTFLNVPDTGTGHIRENNADVGTWNETTFDWVGGVFKVTAGYVELSEIVAPATPGANLGRLYAADVATVTHVFFKNSAGTEFDLTGTGSPAGADTQVQFNNAGAFGADASLVFSTTANGILTVGAGVTGDATFRINGQNGNQRLFQILTSGSLRWQLAGTNTAEASVDVGTDLTISAYNNSGVLIDTPITLDRSANGLLQIARPTEINQGVITVAQEALRISSTWNNGAATMFGLRVVITDTASAAASRAFSVEPAGGSEWFAVFTDNTAQLFARTAAQATFKVRNDFTNEDSSYELWGASAMRWGFRNDHSVGHDLIIESAGDTVITIGQTASTGVITIERPLLTNSYMDFTEIAVPATPPAGQGRVYNNINNGKLYFLDSTGANFDLVFVAAGSNGDVQIASNGLLSTPTASAFNYDTVNKSLDLTQGAVTTAQPILDMTSTWNGGAITFTAVDVNVTNTASAAASKLIDLRLGGSTQFSVRKDGLISASAAALAQGTITVAAPILNMTATWNSGAVTFTGVLVNVTDTTSAAASLLADLQIGGVSQFSVGKAGVVNATGHYAIDGTQVVGNQDTGWTDQTATPSKADLGASPTVGALSSWAAAVDDMLKAHGLTTT